jgi:tRNA1Val (adenine37-N6)-methyltransferase
LESFLKAGERLDDLQRNGYQIIQHPNKFCFGMDAVLLSGFAKAAREDRVLDLGTGTGIIPLLLAAKTEADQLFGLEIQEESVDMARRSVALNGLEERIKIITGDMKEAGRLFQAASFHVITCNPPYMIESHGIRNPNDAKSIARHEVLCTFQDVVRETAKLLVPGGKFYLVHRPFRLPEIMKTLMEYGLEPKRMRMVHASIEKEPTMLLVEAVRGGKPRMSVERPLILFEAPGKYAKEIVEEYGF